MQFVICQKRDLCSGQALKAPPYGRVKSNQKHFAKYS